MRIIFTFFLSFTIFSSAYSQIYEYPVKPGTEAWKQLNSHDEMVNVTQLPEEFLRTVKTIDLLQTCLNYPLLLDMLAYNNPKLGVEAVTAKFNGLQYLIKRSDAGIMLFEKYKSMLPENIDNLKSDSEKGNYTFMMSIVETLLANNDILKQLNQEQKKEILKEILIKNESKKVYKHLFGTLGQTTLAYIAVKTLTELNDPLWQSYSINNKNIKLFNDYQVITNPDIIDDIFLKVKEVLNK